MLFEAIYYEEEVLSEPLAQRLLKRYEHLPQIACHHFGEIFNPKNQNFRIQKQAPSLILAKKHNQLVLKTPQGYGIGGESNYYFSHMFNCIYDCRYCFLQGMYRSGHYVIFVNQEDFISEMKSILSQHEGEDVYFFSGYDCDSLALESVTQFVQSILPFFKEHPSAILELRTKSVSFGPFLDIEPLDNVVIASTLSPDWVTKEIEHKTPSLKHRLNALHRLTEKGWKVGFRFDPLIASKTFKEDYQELIKSAFASIDESLLHSVTTGPLRMPKRVHKRMVNLYPDEAILYQGLNLRGDTVSYPEDLELDQLHFVNDKLLKYTDRSKIFSIQVDQGVCV